MKINAALAVFGVLALLILLTGSGVIQGNLSMQKVGCLQADGGGMKLESWNQCEGGR